MRPSVVNITNSPCDVYIGRGGKGGLQPSIWGNPFRIGADGSREEVITRYRDYLLQSPTLLFQLPNLAGKTLGCHCHPLACHGDVLLEWANHPHGIWHVLAPQLSRAVVVEIMALQRSTYDQLWAAGRRLKVAQPDNRVGHPFHNQLHAISDEKTRLQVAWNTCVDLQWDAIRRNDPHWEQHRRHWLAERV